MTLVNPAKASAPRSFLEPWESWRTITAGRRARSHRLLVGSMAGSCRNSSTLPRSCCRPIPSSSRWLSSSFSMRGRRWNVSSSSIRSTSASNFSALPARWSRQGWRASRSRLFSFSPKLRARPVLCSSTSLIFSLMVQAFLLLYAQELLGIVTLAAVGHRYSRIVGGNQFPYLFVVMPAANLKHRGLVGIEGHQMGCLPVNPPPGVIGVNRRRGGHPGTQLLVGIPYHSLRLLQRVRGQGALRHFDSGELPQDGGQLAHRNAHAVMHRMRRGLHAGTYRCAVAPY